MNILPVGADLFHADGRTDRQTDRNYEANGLFSQFCELSQEAVSCLRWLVAELLQKRTGFNPGQFSARY
jgi:hypothetical protein